MKVEILFILAALVAMQLPRAVHAGAPVSTLSQTDVAAINKVIESLRKAVVSGNVATVLEHISPREGLSCTDTEYSYAEAAKMLKDRNSVFYLGLFDSAGFRKECGDDYPADYPAISEKEFFSSASHEAQIETLDENRVMATIRSPAKSHYKRWLYLHREGATWKVASGSFIIGNCSCGG